MALTLQSLSRSFLAATAQLFVHACILHFTRSIVTPTIGSLVEQWQLTSSCIRPEPDVDGDLTFVSCTMLLCLTFT